MPDLADSARPAAPPLLRTKLFMPQSLPDLVARPRLMRLLNEGLTRPLTLIAASAGSGKTTLLSMWLAQCGVPVAWVSLDERDNDPTRFWSYVIAALQMHFPACGSTALAMLQAPQPPGSATMLTELLNDLTGAVENAADKPGFVLALDDYHAVTAPEIHVSVAFLADHLGPAMRLALASRSDPPLPLPRWRARRWLTEIHLADLRFTVEEAAEFLARTAGLALPADAVKRLAALTEGWAAGLQMAALSLQSAKADTTGLVQTLTGRQRYIFDYLAQEVLDHQSADVQAFLLRTAILDRMCGALCDALLDSGAAEQNSETAESQTRHGVFPFAPPLPHSPAQEVLGQLERANLFVVPLDEDRQWYRYHHLFSDFLRARLAQEVNAGQIAALRRRASAWYASQGFAAEAIEQALAAGDMDAAAGLIRSAATLMFARNEITTIAAWLAALPADLVSHSPPLSFLYAWALLATGRHDAVEGHLINVERTLGVLAVAPRPSPARPGCSDSPGRMINPSAVNHPRIHPAV